MATDEGKKAETACFYWSCLVSKKCRRGVPHFASAKEAKGSTSAEEVLAASAEEAFFTSAEEVDLDHFLA